MIYCVNESQYPTKERYIEELKYKDENDFEWRIARIENGFMVRYFGDKYFKENTFECDLSNGEHIRVNNTNCIFFQDSDFETFCDIRYILSNGYTDDIWETFEELFTERFEHDKDMLESEMLA